MHERSHTARSPRSPTLAGCAQCTSPTRALLCRTSGPTPPGSSPYVCSMCPKRLAQKGDVIPHARTHTGEKPQRLHHVSKVVQPEEQRCASRADPHWQCCVGENRSTTALRCDRVASSDALTMTPPPVHVCMHGWCPLEGKPSLSYMYAYRFTSVYM